MSDLSSLFSVEGKTAFVTGGSTGIGYMIVETLLSGGAKVYTCGRDVDRLNKAREQLAKVGELHCIQADISTNEGVEEIKRHLYSNEKKLHILINNAASSFRAPLAEHMREAFQQLLNMNLVSTFEIIKMALPLLKAGATTDDRAKIINIGSVGSTKVFLIPNYSYCASKAGVDFLTRQLGAEFAPDNINVNCIAPGLFRTELSAHLFDKTSNHYKNRPFIPMDRPGLLEDIAGAVLYFSSRASNYVSGERIMVSGGVGTIDYDRPQQNP